VTSREGVRLLREAGFKVVRDGGSHVIMDREEAGRMRRMCVAHGTVSRSMETIILRLVSGRSTRKDGTLGPQGQKELTR
jgi:predicted RNA binding protein YcfA (HicA-like mRNA interferase family)